MRTKLRADRRVRCGGCQALVRASVLDLEGRCDSCQVQDLVEWPELLRAGS